MTAVNLQWNMFLPHKHMIESAVFCHAILCEVPAKRLEIVEVSVDSCVVYVLYSDATTYHSSCTCDSTCISLESAIGSLVGRGSSSSTFCLDGTRSDFDRSKQIVVSLSHSFPTCTLLFTLALWNIFATRSFVLNFLPLQSASGMTSNARYSPHATSIDQTQLHTLWFPNIVKTTSSSYRTRAKTHRANGHSGSRCGCFKRTYPVAHALQKAV